MLDFLIISYRYGRNGIVEIFPDYAMITSSDLMIRGGDFYAIWCEEKSLWSTDEQDAVHLIDRELDIYREANLSKHPEFEHARVLHLFNAGSGQIDKWHKYCRNQMWDNFHPLDENIIFSNTQTRKEDYASKHLSYPLEACETPAYNKLMGVLYSNEERTKIEWAIGAIISGDSKRIQKFLVLYGPIGTGKSTVLDIIQKLFDGYWSAFESKTLGSSTNVFSLEAFRDNPLIAIEHDGDLSRIEDNTRINSLVSHETMMVNIKHERAYSQRFNTFLILGTNKAVRITDAKSGIIRRLIDVEPTGNKLPEKEYDICKSKLDFELSGIAKHCLDVYNEMPDRYSNYIPTRMISATNDFYNFILDNSVIFAKEDCVTLKSAWEMYRTYATDSNLAYPLSRTRFKEELRNYFNDFFDRYIYEDGTRARSVYVGFKTDKFKEKEEPVEKTESLILDHTESLLDRILSDCPAQYAENDIPKYAWDNVTTKLKDLDTTKTHYVRPPDNMVVIDFDIRDESGNKSFDLNLEAASKFPLTYAEVSKSGSGIHLHYIYDGEVKKLRNLYSPGIEVKTFTGKQALRRKVILCNDIPVTTINSGLPIKEGKKMVDSFEIKNEKTLRQLIEKNLRKEIMPNTKPSIELIAKDIQAAYDSGVPYDISDLRGRLVSFAANSTNNAEYCLKLVGKLQFKSKVESDPVASENDILVFFDCEVFPNLFVVCWKIDGDGKPVIRMINPKPCEIEELLKFKLVGFNCRRYDNHILYARLMGFNNEQLYSLSQRIITEGSGFFGEAYNISYTDVYDFSSKKQSLKKFEVELGITHQECGIRWDEPVPDELWEKVADYCCNDVIATEAVFHDRNADFVAREILADISGSTVNDTTNTLTTRIIFGREKHPQSAFNYRYMGDESESHSYMFDDLYSSFTVDHKPIFPGYLYEAGVSTYRGEEVGEGGYVYAEPGMYSDVALLDIASMHPSSIIAENLFGDEYTSRFKDLVDIRIAIKHKDFDAAKKLFNGKLERYLTDEKAAKSLAQALKIAINSVYGLTSAKFENPFRDIRNKDNIVAKRGALFMVNLKHQVLNRGFPVAHIKTDSIKIPNATKEIIQFVMDYGKAYGYNFEHEATYERMCLVNDAVYIARYQTGEWTATGKQFQVPYVFKTLFSDEKIEFKDLCETMSASTALYLDKNERLPDGEHNYSFIGKVGSFTPVKDGYGGGLLLRQNSNNDGYSYAAGAKGYRWLESEDAKRLGMECIDYSYYDHLVKDAKANIEKYGDFDAFRYDPYPPDDTLPF